MNLLVSAGEASGEFYAAALVDALRRRHPEWTFFGASGDRLARAGVRPVIDSSKLAVVGLAEVVTHLPAIFGEYRRLIAAARDERPDLAILVDNQAFHARVARALHDQGIPVVQMIAPQAWAWREGRVRPMRRNLSQLLCIFPFEEPWFRERGVSTTFIGHPLARRIRAWQAAHPPTRDGQGPLIALLPGSRRGEIARHLPLLLDAVARIHKSLPGARFVISTTSTVGPHFFDNQIAGTSIQVVVDQTWDLLSRADLALAASGTVTTEAALFGTPMVAFYRVSELSWKLGRRLVRAPFFTMVNLIAGTSTVPELIQHQATGPNLAREALLLLTDASAREAQQAGLARVAQLLATEHDPMEIAADAVEALLPKPAHA